MRVLHLTRQFYPAIGGIESVVRNLCLALTERGIEVEVITLNRLWDQAAALAPEEVVDGLRVRRVPFVGPRRYAMAPGVLRHLNGYDLIHLHSSDFFLDFVALTQFIHRRPIFLHTHGFYFHTPFAGGLKKLYFQTATRLALTKVRGILVDSEHDRKLAQKIAPAEKIRLVPNGVSTELFQISDENRDPRHILCVGRLASNKRYDLLLQAFSLALKQAPDIRLTLIGKDQGQGGMLMSLVNQLGIGEQVEFLGEVTRLELMAQLGRAGVWAMASEYESFGIGLLEALSAGCVPVVSGIPAHRELVTDGLTGLLADFTQAESAAEALLRAVGLPQPERSMMQARARESVRAYTWPKIAEQIEHVYRNCTGPI